MGLWPSDKSTQSPQLTDKSGLFELAIWPKLYRRLVRYFDGSNADHTSLFGFRDWLHTDRSGRDDFIIVLPIVEILNFSDILTITADTINMNFPLRTW